MSKSWTSFKRLLANAAYFATAFACCAWILTSYFHYYDLEISILPMAAMCGVLAVSSFLATVAVVAVLNLVKRDRLLADSSAFRLSWKSQKLIRVAALLMPLPILAYCGTVAYFYFSPLKAWDALQNPIVTAETSIFGNSLLLAILIDKTSHQTIVRAPLGLDIDRPLLEHFQTFSDSDSDLGPYIQSVYAKIKGLWPLPKDSIGENTIAQFSIAKDGHISNLRIERSSRLDGAALKAIESAAPFTPLPSGCPEPLDIEFSFYQVDHKVLDVSDVFGSAVTVPNADGKSLRKP